VHNQALEQARRHKHGSWSATGLVGHGGKHARTVSTQQFQKREVPSTSSSPRLPPTQQRGGKSRPVGWRSPPPTPRQRPAPEAMALDLAIGGSAARRAETQTLAPVLLMGPPPPPPIPPMTGMYFVGPPTTGALLPLPIPVALPHEVIMYMDECRSRSLLKVKFEA
jgi:hypothetical protein